MMDTIETRRTAEMQAVLTPVLRFLDDPVVTDVMLNLDGRLFVDGYSGMHDTGMVIDDDAARRILRQVAFSIRAPITSRTPIINNAMLPGGRYRFAGTYPPVTKRPTFAIRAHSKHVRAEFASLPPSVALAATDGLASHDDRLEALKMAVRARKNVWIGGAPGAGKTSLLNILIKEMRDDRIIVLEDILPEGELSIDGLDNVVRFISVKDVASLHDLLMLTLRYRPDRIVVGELLEGKAAQALIRASNIGIRGNLTTFHANSAKEARMRVEAFCQDAYERTPTSEISSAMDIVAFVERRGDKRGISEIFECT